MMCKLNGRNMIHILSPWREEMEGWMERVAIMMCKLDKGHYDVQIKRWMKKVAL